MIKKLIVAAFLALVPVTGAYAQESVIKACTSIEMIETQAKANNLTVKRTYSGPEARTIRQTIAELAEVPLENIVEFDLFTVYELEDVEDYLVVAFKNGCVAKAGTASPMEYMMFTRKLRTADGR